MKIIRISQVSMEEQSQDNVFAQPVPDQRGVGSQHNFDMIAPEDRERLSYLWKAEEYDPDDYGTIVGKKEGPDGFSYKDSFGGVFYPEELYIKGEKKRFVNYEGPGNKANKIWERADKDGEYFCSDCSEETFPKKVDFGIGPYEFWGARGFHKDIRTVSDCCGGTIEDRYGNEVDPEKLEGYFERDYDDYGD